MKPAYAVQKAFAYDFALVLSSFLSLAHSRLQFFLSLQQADSLAHLAPFLQQDFPSANAAPETITAATSNKVSFFIVSDFMIVKIGKFNITRSDGGQPPVITSL
jgi:hypothetical protein